MTESTFQPPGPEAKVFIISVAAELSGLHPQTLRTYDRLGLVQPGRTGGGGRRYSVRDIELLQRIAQLTSEGLGLEGVKRVIELEVEVQSLREHVARLEATIAGAEVPNLPVRFAAQQVTVWKRRR